MEARKSVLSEEKGGDSSPPSTDKRFFHMWGNPLVISFQFINFPLLRGFKEKKFLWSYLIPHTVFCYICKSP